MELESVNVEDAYVGRTGDGRRVYLSMGLSRQSGGQTVEHEPTPAEYLRFSASGYETERGTWAAGGQMLDSLPEVTEPAKGLTLADLRRIHELWSAWHLNDMQAACAHMPADARERWDRRETVECEAGSGYRYGTAWLVRPIPADVEAEIRTLCAKIWATL